MMQYDWQQLLEQMLQAQNVDRPVYRMDQQQAAQQEKEDQGMGMNPKMIEKMMDKFRTPQTPQTPSTPSTPASAPPPSTPPPPQAAPPPAMPPPAAPPPAAPPPATPAGAPAGGGGMAALLPVAYIAAAIGGQLVASNNTDTVVDGQKTGNVFTGIGDGGWNPSFATEPWLAWGHDKLGWEPTEGENFDAAVNNSDWSTALKRLPAAADYWADPLRNWAGEGVGGFAEDITGSEDVGKALGFVFDPISGLLSQIEDWF